MAENSSFNIFGFEINRKKKKKENSNPSLVSPDTNDGAVEIDSSSSLGSGYFSGVAFSTEDNKMFKDESSIIHQYRKMEEHSEIDYAIDDIVTAAVATDPGDFPVSISMDTIDTISDSIKEKISEEFYDILKLMNFHMDAYEIFRRWYVDGRLYYHNVIDTKNPRKGIVELRRIDPLHIKKIREVTKEKSGNIEVVKGVEEYFIFKSDGTFDQGQGVKIFPDSISFATSGLVGPNKIVRSYLHKAMKPLNNLRMVEDASVIYRVTRAPERRVFYIDVGDLPKTRAEQYVRTIMNRYNNKLVYNPDTGEVENNKSFSTMMEDFWMPRKEGGKGTEIQTLPGGQGLGEMDDIVYFQRKLYRSLNVPMSRLDSESSLNFGRGNEITRDEYKFDKFVKRLQKKFSHIFYDILKKQLLLKNIITTEDWEEIKDEIRFIFEQDMYYSEMKDVEILSERINMLSDIENYVGKYFSIEFVRKNILKQDEEDIKEMEKQINKEKSAGLYNDQDDGY